MKNKNFNPLEWIPKKENNNQVVLDNISLSNKNKPVSKEQSNGYIQTPNDIEELVNSIVAAGIDITDTYKNWMNIGFALSDEFGESGRSYFHQISSFHANYSNEDCDKQFDKCIEAKGHGISIATLFYLAQAKGIQINKSNQYISDITNSPPSFPNSLYTQIPEFLLNITNQFSSPEDKDMMLLGSIVTLSSCMPNYIGYYDRKRVYPNLYLFVTAQASAGKGNLVHCKQLVKPIHKRFRAASSELMEKYNTELSDYNKKKKKGQDADKPKKPPELMLFIPANSSATGMFQLLYDNDGKGLIFETEGDTLTNAFKSDFGNYSSGFRQAFHHETITYYRRTDREYVDIDEPRISTILTGTPNQILSLIPDAENGLFSRFIFYSLKVNLDWRNVFSNPDECLDDIFDTFSKEYLSLYEILISSRPIRFELTKEQQSKFNNSFQFIQTKYINIKGLDYLATVRRLGIITFRISMILTMLRFFETGNTSSTLICDDTDFKTALLMVRVLVEHSSMVFSKLPNQPQKAKYMNTKEKFISQLPTKFNRNKYLEIAESLSIKPKTAEGYIAKFLKDTVIHRESHDHYIKVNTE